MSDLRVIGEVSDGLEAVQKCVELQPDLILLDISLPSLNGIKAARQIRRLVPESKVIFLTQESSVDVVQEALSLGAQGYVVKVAFATDSNSVSGTVNREKPQSKQTTSFGNNKTPGLSKCLSPGKCTSMSAVNSACLTD